MTIKNKLNYSINTIKNNWTNVFSVKVDTINNKSKTICYRYINMLGRGTFGVVVRIRELFSNNEYALKKVYQDSRYHNRELDILKQITHKNIVNLKYFYYEDDSISGKYLNLIMEYYPLTLESLISVDLKETDIRNWCIQLIEGLKYLHSKNICHRDIKPSNILIDSTFTNVKICDLGSAKIIQKDSKNISYICSRWYRAPENILGIEVYDTKIDIWSLGCVMAEVHLKYPLFKSNSNGEMIKEILKIVYCNKADLIELRCDENLLNSSALGIKKYLHQYIKDENLVEVYSNMIVFNPSKRSNAIELLRLLLTHK